MQQLGQWLWLCGGVMVGTQAGQVGVRLEAGRPCWDQQLPSLSSVCCRCSPHKRAGGHISLWLTPGRGQEGTDRHTRIILPACFVQVPLPPDAEGLVLTNINCHMGGVYLWETGHPAPPIEPPPGASLSLKAAAHAVTQPRRQALAGE